MISDSRQIAAIEAFISILNDPSRMPKPSQRHMLIDDANAVLARLRNAALRRENEGKPS